MALGALIQKVTFWGVIGMTGGTIGLALMAEGGPTPAGGGVTGRTLAGVMVPGPIIRVTGSTIGLALMAERGAAPTGGGVAANQWWEWDLLIGSWWGRGGQLSTGTHKLGQWQCWADGCVTIEAIVEIYPDARIISQAGVTGTGGIRLQYGFGGNSHEYIGHVDKLVVGLATGDTITYDFELGPEDKDACKDGGWVGFTRNQGQCVSYFESNRPH